MEKTKKQIQVFAIFYAFLGVLNILAMILEGTWDYLFKTLLAFIFAFGLYNASKDETKFRMPLSIGVVILALAVIEVVETFLNGGGLFMAATSILEAVLVFYVISSLNKLRNEVTITADTKPKVKEENKEN